MELTEIADSLAATGGWGVAVVLGYFFWKKDQEHGKERREWLAYAIETTEVISSLREVIRRCHKREDSND